jgi:hypothetical protein
MKQAKTEFESFIVMGVFSGAFQRISYNPETKTLGLSNASASSTITETGKISSSQQTSQSHSNKQLTETDELPARCNRKEWVL